MLTTDHLKQLTLFQLLFLEIYYALHLYLEKAMQLMEILSMMDVFGTFMFIIVVLEMTN